MDDPILEQKQTKKEKHGTGWKTVAVIADFFALLLGVAAALLIVRGLHAPPTAPQEPVPLADREYSQDGVRITLPENFSPVSAEGFFFGLAAEERVILFQREEKSKLASAMESSREITAAAYARRLLSLSLFPEGTVLRDENGLIFLEYKETDLATGEIYFCSIIQLHATTLPPSRHSPCHLPQRGRQGFRRGGIRILAAIGGALLWQRRENGSFDSLRSLRMT